MRVVGCIQCITDLWWDCHRLWMFMIFEFQFSVMNKMLPPSQPWPIDSLETSVEPDIICSGKTWPEDTWPCLGAVFDHQKVYWWSILHTMAVSGGSSFQWQQSPCKCQWNRWHCSSWCTDQESKIFSWFPQYQSMVNPGSPFLWCLCYPPSRYIWVLLILNGWMVQAWACTLSKSSFPSCLSFPIPLSPLPAFLPLIFLYMLSALPILNPALFIPHFAWWPRPLLALSYLFLYNFLY